MLKEGLILIHAGLLPTKAWDKVAKRHGIKSRSTLYNWYAIVHKHPMEEWPELLQSKYGIHRKGQYAECTPEAYDYFKQLYLDGNCRAEAFRRLKAVSDSKGWVIPSRNALSTRLERDGIRPTSRDAPDIP